MSKSNFILGVIISAVGLLLLLIPSKIVEVIIIVLGAETVINGILSLVTMRRLSPDESYRKAVTIRGAVSILIGLLAIFLPMVIAEAMWKIIFYVLGIYLLLSAVSVLLLMGKLRHTNVNRKQYNFEAFISIVIAVILFLIPQDIGTFVLRVLGAAILLSGAVYIYIGMRTAKENKEILDNVVIEDDK